MPNYLDSILELAKQATPLPWEKDICAIDPEMGGVITEEDKVNCATDFCECLLAAAEHAAKEDGE